jgi:hypothetical protein
MLDRNPIECMRSGSMVRYGRTEKQQLQSIGSSHAVGQLPHPLDLSRRLFELTTTRKLILLEKNMQTFLHALRLVTFRHGLHSTRMCSYGDYLLGLFYWLLQPFSQSSASWPQPSSERSFQGRRETDRLLQNVFSVAEDRCRPYSLELNFRSIIREQQFLALTPFEMA